LHRIGREFTILDVDEISYPAIIKALRANKVIMTAEFHPAEGKYYLTGHSAAKHKNLPAIYFRDEIPADLRCPLCGKTMFLGVKQRCLELRDPRIVPLNRNYMHLVPLLEVIATALQSGLQTKSVWNEYQKVLSVYPSEIALWQSDAEEIEDKLDKEVRMETLHTILAIREERFDFDPPGFDSQYGKLVIDLP
jgi:PHP family Zn ribbon phosphoesterase